MIEYCEYVQDEVTFEVEQRKIPNLKRTKQFFVCDHQEECSIKTMYCPKFRKLYNLEPIDDDTF